MNCIMPIKTIYADMIRAGTKTVELRKRKMKPCEFVYLYEISPVSAITLKFKWHEPIEAAPEELWEIVKDNAGITQQEYNEYFKTMRMAYAYPITKIYHIGIQESNKLLKDKNPPQSYIYTI